MKSQLSIVSDQNDGAISRNSVNALFSTRSEASYVTWVQYIG